MERLFQDARGRARGEFADEINQAVRRIRQSTSEPELLATLADAAGSFAEGVAVFRIDGESARGVRIRGVAEEVAQVFSDFEIPLASAAALAGAVETRDPVIAATIGSEVSGEMAGLAPHGSRDRASIFPVVVDDAVPALLYGWGEMQGPALELLSQVAAAAWVRPPAPPADLISIAPAPEAPPAEPAAGAAEPEPEWSGEEERVHLKAQRFARVAVAQMRLQDAAAVHAGAAQKNLYGTLRSRIESARIAMREQFIDTCPGMVDYLHRELIRSLANDDPELLGENYPGVML